MDQVVEGTYVPEKALCSEAFTALSLVDKGLSILDISWTEPNITTEQNLRTSILRCTWGDELQLLLLVRGDTHSRNIIGKIYANEPSSQNVSPFSCSVIAQIWNCSVAPKQEKAMNRFPRKAHQVLMTTASGWDNESLSQGTENKEKTSRQLFPQHEDILQEDGSVAKLLVLYTDASREEADGQGSIEDMILLSVAELNQALRDSLIPTEVELTAIQLVHLDTTAQPLEQILYKLYHPNDGVLDHIHELRDQVGADLVQLVVGARDGLPAGETVAGAPAARACGVGYLLFARAGPLLAAAAAAAPRGTGGGSWEEGGSLPIAERLLGPLLACEASFAFGLSLLSCMMNDLSFAHEIGHSFGLGHDFCNSGRNTTFFVDAHGYRRCPGNRNNREEGMQSIRTIMSYDCGLCSECTECDTASGQLRTPGAGIEEGILIPYFSNPNVYFQGAPIGFPSVQQLLGEKEEEEEKGNEPLFEPRGGNLVQKKISSNSIRDSDKKDLLPLSSGADNARVMSITRHFVANFRNAFNNKTLDSTTRAQYCPIPDFNPPNISTAMQALDCRHLTLQSYIRKSLVFACQMEDFIFTASLLAMTMFLCAIICIMIVRTSGRR